MSWECRDCGHSTTWTARPDTDEGHVIERRIVEHMPLHAITALYGERGLRERFATETARLGDPVGRRKIKQVNAVTNPAYPEGADSDLATANT